MKIPVMRMREKLVVRVVSRFFIPFILLFGLYVQFHGDFGPGGGFPPGGSPFAPGGGGPPLGDHQADRHPTE